MNLFEDEYRSVLYLPDLTTLLTELVYRAKAIAPGLYNAGGLQSVNRVQFAQAICSAFSIWAYGRFSKREPPGTRGAVNRWSVYIWIARALKPATIGVAPDVPLKFAFSPGSL